jgi:DNA-binding beta-propeller fold protein YncE
MRAALLVFALIAAPADDLPKPAGTIALPNVTGRIDHFAFDAERGRLFVCALGNETVEAIDVAKGQVVKSLARFGKPQGLAAIPATKQVAFAAGGDGKLHVLDAESIAEVKSLDAGANADNVRLDPKESGDPKRARVWVGTDEGVVAFAVADWKRVASVKLAAHAESFQLEAAGPRLFANVPNAHHVAVVDREKGEVVATWALDGAADNFPMAFDEKNARLYVACRSPAQVLAFDTKSGKIAAKAAIGGDCDDLFFDPERMRLYATCGEGCLSVVAIGGDGALTPAGKVDTATGARTSLFVPALAKIFVAVPKSERHDAELRVFTVGSASDGKR